MRYLTSFKTTARHIHTCPVQTIIKTRKSAKYIAFAIKILGHYYFYEG